MFDIKFFEKAAAIKSEIVDGKVTHGREDEILAAFETMRNPAPYVFNVETTNYCNMKCVMCPRTSLMTRKNVWIDDEAFEHILDQIQPHPEEEYAHFKDFVMEEYRVDETTRSENAFYFGVSARCLTLHGYGEPLLDKNIVRRIQACTVRGIPTYFSCVPANIDVDKIDTLMSNGLGVIKFSVDSLDDDEQRRIRGNRNDFTQSYEKILNVLERKAEKGYRTLVVVTMIALANDEETYREQREFIELWKGKEVFAYVKSQDNRWYHEEDERLVNRSHYEDQYCEFPWTSLTVMANGKVVPCTQDYDAEMEMGDATQAPLRKIWNGEKYADLRRWHVTGEFPKGFKCSERCDLKKLHQYIAKPE